MNEKQYEKKLKSTIKKMFPGCVIMKNDPAMNQGVPDILVLYKNRWGMLEIKIDETANHQPNQDYYVNLYNDLSFAAFINPDNEEAVLSDLQQAFGVRGTTRIP